MSRTVVATLDALERAAGTLVATSPWLAVPQATIDAFAAATGDAQWIHVDRERARRESPYGTTVAHGFLTLALLPSLVEAAIAFPAAAVAVNYGFDRVRFIGPVPSDAEIAGAFALERVERVAGGADATWRVEVRVRGREKPALAAVWLTRILVSSAPRAAERRNAEAHPQRDGA